MERREFLKLAIAPVILPKFVLDKHEDDKIVIKNYSRVETMYMMQLRNHNWRPYKLYDNYDDGTEIGIIPLFNRDKNLNRIVENHFRNDSSIPNSITIFLENEKKTHCNIVYITSSCPLEELVEEYENICDGKINVQMFYPEQNVYLTRFIK